jgi:hypothetical protein
MYTDTVMQKDGGQTMREETHMPKIKGYCILSVENQQIMDFILQRSHWLRNKNLLVREFVKNTTDMDRIDLETCLRRVCVMNIPADITED